MLSLIRRWILPTSAPPSAFNFFSPHYVPALSTIASTRPFSTYPPLHSDNKPSNPGAKSSNAKPHPPPPSSSTDTLSTTSRSVPSPADDNSPFKPVVTPAWNELMTILSKHVYDAAWTPEAQARYTQIIKQYPYISPETQYATGVPMPPGMSSREACQSAAEEAFFADYRPLRAGFAEDYTESVAEGEDELAAADWGTRVVQVAMTKGQVLDFVKSVVGKDVDSGEFTPLVAAFAVSRFQTGSDEVAELTSTRRKRYIKMKNHKRRKLRRKQRAKMKKLGKI